jgi:hypothetical protein
MTRRSESELGGPLWAAIGTLAAITAAGLMSRERGVFSQEIVLLTLVVIIVGAAALGGKVAGLYTALVASLSFNFFHTQPYSSLRIHSARDIVSTVLLFVVGLVVGALAMSRERARAELDDDDDMLAGLALQADLLARGAPTAEAWAVTRSVLIDHLLLADCRYEPAAGSWADPGASRNGRPAPSVLTFTAGGFALPPEGAELSVEHGGRMLGRIVLVPRADRPGVSPLRRRFAITAAEQFAVAVYRETAADSVH